MADCICPVRIRRIALRRRRLVIAWSREASSKTEMPDRRTGLTRSPYRLAEPLPSPTREGGIGSMSLSSAVCFASREVDASFTTRFAVPFLTGRVRAAPMSSPTNFRRDAVASYLAPDFFGAEAEATCVSSSFRIGCCVAVRWSLSCSRAGPSRIFEDARRVGDS